MKSNNSGKPGNPKAVKVQGVKKPNQFKAKNGKKPQNKPQGKDKNQKSSKFQRGKESDSKINYVVNPNRLKHQMKETEKQQKREAFQKQKDEKARKFNDYQKRQMEKNKILGQKTRHGQPVMKGRMEMLLNKIQHQISKESM